MQLTRKPGWEARFAEVMADAKARPYVLGEHDCLRVACATVAALTGVDFWPRFAGYTSKRAALVTIARIGASLADAVTATLGRHPVEPMLARRGDIVLFRDASGEDHLGVVTGYRVAVTAPEGLLQLTLSHPGVLMSWRIG